jgi:KaiC/GvpD/RAD55 family RecA-like ATPase
MFTALQPGHVINFLQSIAARVKANGGKLCVTVGTGIDKADMMKLEENSDRVIETELQNSNHGQNRRLRIKKLRDSSYSDRWTRFQMEIGKGIIFLIRRT